MNGITAGRQARADFNPCTLQSMRGPMHAKKFILEISLLEPGDIILTGTKEPASLGVRAATASRYSHAAIWVGDTLIEATLNGVFSKNPQRLLFDRIDDVAVFRSIGQVPDIGKFCDYARSKTGTLYALAEAITVRGRSALNMQATRKQFCSRLVAQAYASCGFNFINLRHPAFCTPRQLSTCRAFRRQANMVHLATDDDIAYSARPDPGIDHQKNTFAWLNRVRDLVQHAAAIPPALRDIQSMNDVSRLLQVFPEYDDAVSGFVRDSGYLDDYKVDEDINGWRYDPLALFAVMRNSGDPAEVVLRELRKEPSLHRKYIENLFMFLMFATRQPLEYYRLHIALYVNLITHARARTENMCFCASALCLTNALLAASMLLRRMDDALRFAREHLPAPSAGPAAA